MIEDVLYKMILMSSIDGFWQVNFDSGMILEVNNSYCRMSGYSREELLNLTIDKIEYTESKDEINFHMLKIKSLGYDVFDTKHRCKDGKIIDVEVSVQYRDDFEGQCVAFIRDISERKKIEQLQKQIEFILGATKTGLDIIDEDLNLRYVDPEWQKVYGDPNGKKCYDYFMGRKNECPKCCIHQAIATKSKTVTEEFLVKEGNRPIQVTTIPFQDEKGEWLVAEVNVDISERKRIENELKRLYEMEKNLLHSQRLDSLGVLAAGIAHDANNVLTSILGNADLLIENHKFDPEVSNDLKEIRDSSLRLSVFFRQLLAYSGRGKFIVEPINLLNVLNEMKKIFSSTVSKHVSLNYNFPTECPNIFADISQINQVVLNLVINASDAIGDVEGNIDISLSTVYVPKNKYHNLDMKFLDEGSYIRLEISDSGCGMDEQTRLKIFDPFYTTKKTGRGLGLSAVFGIIRGHNGVVNVSSVPGKGSHFEILFPVDKSDRKNLEEKKTDQWIGKGTVLVVDDEKSVRRLAMRMLSKLGFSVIEAEDGQEAVKLFQKNEKIEFILLDLSMPKLSGMQTYNNLCGKGYNIKTIFMSGFSDNEVVDKLSLHGDVLHGDVFFIHKPFSLSDFREIVKEVTNK